MARFSVLMVAASTACLAASLWLSSGRGVGRQKERARASRGHA